MRTASASSDWDVAEISIDLPISRFALLRRSRSWSRKITVNMSGIARRSTTRAPSSADFAAGSRSLPSTLTVGVLGTDVVSGIGSGLLFRVRLGGHEQRGPGHEPHRVVDGVELGDRAPVRRLAELAVGEALERLALDHGPDAPAVDGVR